MLAAVLIVSVLVNAVVVAVFVRYAAGRDALDARDRVERAERLAASEARMAAERGRLYQRIQAPGWATTAHEIDELPPSPRAVDPFDDGAFWKAQGIDV